MTSNRRWHRAALGAISLVIVMVALGVLLEHTVGSAWAGGGPKGVIATPHTRFDPSATRIPLAVKRQLLSGQRLGGRYGGSDFSNLQALRKAVVVQLGIAGIVVVLMLAWRRSRARRRPSRHG